MKRKETDDRIKISGYYINEFTRGFLGEQNEGNKMLKQMGLPINEIPFSVAIFLQNKRIRWKDSEGNVAAISFKLKPNQMECFGSYLGQKKSIRVFREWGSHEDLEVIAKLESEAIGDLCMKCIYENLIERH